MRDKLEQLAEITKEVTGIDVRYARGRRQSVVRPKAAFATIASRWYGIELVKVAEKCGWLCYNGIGDHSIVSHHRNNHKGRYKSDDEYAEIYDSIMKRLAMDKEDVGQINSIVELINEL